MKKVDLIIFLNSIQKQAPEIVLKLENNTGDVKIKDIKDLILWIVADGVNPKWVMV